jgi:hypothetical protein
MRHHITTGLAVFVAFAGSHAFAQTAPPPAAAAAPKLPSTSLGIVVFPAKGQTPDLQGKDESECYAWSKGQTGVDPLAPPAPAPQPAQAAAAQPAQPAAEQPADRSRLRGAARGAAAGAVIGEVANDDAGEGAAIGATAGVLKGGAEKRHAQAAAKQQAAQQQQAATQQSQQATADQKALFGKGFGTCLEARGYTVK